MRERKTADEKKVDENPSEEYIFLDDTGKRNIYIESFQTNSCTRPLGRVHEFDLKTRDRNISSRLSPRFYFLCVWVCYSVFLQQ